MGDVAERLSDILVTLQALDREVFERGFRLTTVEQKMGALYRGAKSRPTGAEKPGARARGKTVEESLGLMADAISRIQSNLARQSMDIASMEQRADALYGLGVAGGVGDLERRGNSSQDEFGG
jgi:hypothetical protein